MHIFKLKVKYLNELKTYIKVKKGIVFLQKQCMADSVGIVFLQKQCMADSVAPENI